MRIRDARPAPFVEAISLLLYNTCYKDVMEKLWFANKVCFVWGNYSVIWVK
jgi:hypothetical protein